MGAISTPYLSLFMDQIALKQLYVGLVASDPLTAADPLTTEITGPAYVRQVGNWTRISALALLLSAGAIFSSLGIDTHVAGIAVWDGQYNGNLVARDMLTTPVDFPAGGAYTVAAGSFVIGFDITGL